MRGGNFFYSIPLDGGKWWVVHRGVSQGGRSLSPGARRSFWEKNHHELPGIFWKGGKLFASREAIQKMKKGSLVIVHSPEKPRTVTPGSMNRGDKEVKCFL